jgi:hypothetical protein
MMAVLKVDYWEYLKDLKMADHWVVKLVLIKDLELDLMSVEY